MKINIKSFKKYLTYFSSYDIIQLYKKKSYIKKKKLEKNLTNNTFCIKMKNYVKKGGSSMKVENTSTTQKIKNRVNDMNEESQNQNNAPKEVRRGIGMSDEQKELLEKLNKTMTDERKSYLKNEILVNKLLDFLIAKNTK